MSIYCVNSEPSRFSASPISFHHRRAAAKGCGSRVSGYPYAQLSAGHSGYVERFRHQVLILKLGVVRVITLGPLVSQYAGLSSVGLARRWPHEPFSPVWGHPRPDESKVPLRGTAWENLRSDDHKHDQYDHATKIPNLSPPVGRNGERSARFTGHYANDSGGSCGRRSFALIPPLGLPIWKSWRFHVLSRPKLAVH